MRDFTDTGEQQKVLFDYKTILAALNKGINIETIALYRTRFGGRDDIVPVYWKSKRGDKTGYSPLCKNKWDEKLCNLKKKARGGCRNCKNADYPRWPPKIPHLWPLENPPPDPPKKLT